MQMESLLRNRGPLRKASLCVYLEYWPYWDFLNAGFFFTQMLMHFLTSNIYCTTRTDHQKINSNFAANLEHHSQHCIVRVLADTCTRQCALDIAQKSH